MQRTSSRALALATLTLPLSLLLAGCGQAGDATTASTSEADSVTIVSGQSAQNGELLQGIFDTFNEQKGRDAVELQMNADSDVDTAQQVLLDLAAGAGPDAVRVTNATYRTLVDAGAAQPADTCLAGSEYAEGIDPSVFAGLKIDGTSYQVPWYVTPAALFYNADAFTAAGLDPEAPPATLEAFHEAARAIASTGTPGGVAYFGNDYLFQGYVESAGGRVYDPESGELGLDSRAAARVLDFFGDMSADGSAPVYPNFFVDANEAFSGGNLGMIVSAASAYPQLAANAGFDARMAPLPHFASGEAVSPVSTNGFVITTKDPARQQLVCEALQSLLTPETVTATVEATTTIPLLPAVAEAPDGLAPFYAENPSYVPVKDQALTVWQALPDGANAEYTKLYLDAQLRVLRGESDGAAAGVALQDEATALLSGGK